MKAPLYNLEGTKLGELELSDALFNRAWNPDLVQQILLAQRANARKPWAHAKGRGEVSGGGKKPWKQKHTGRARHGSIRSPIWKGGGVSHGPQKERSFAVKVNKKMFRAAIASILSERLRQNEIKFVVSLPNDIIKTKTFAKTIATITPTMNTLLIPEEKNKNIYRAARNLPKVKALAPQALNVYDLLRHKTILIDQAAIKSMVPSK